MMNRPHCLLVIPADEQIRRQVVEVSSEPFTAHNEIPPRPPTVNTDDHEEVFA